jgi:hypothetical protein
MFTRQAAAKTEREARLVGLSNSRIVTCVCSASPAAVVERPRASGILDEHDRIGWTSALEIIEALAAQRDCVTTAHVYNLKSKRGTPGGYCCSSQVSDGTNQSALA